MNKCLCLLLLLLTGCRYTAQSQPLSLHDLMRIRSMTDTAARQFLTGAGWKDAGRKHNIIGRPERFVYDDTTGAAGTELLLYKSFKGAPREVTFSCGDTARFNAYFRDSLGVYGFAGGATSRKAIEDDERHTVAIAAFTGRAAGNDTRLMIRYFVMQRKAQVAMTIFTLPEAHRSSE